MSRDPRRIADSAKQFEAMMISQMMKVAKGDGSGEDDSANALGDMAGEQFAQLLAANGGVGLAKLVTQALDRADKRMGEEVSHQDSTQPTGRTRP
jgi:Rod binding domain-containing protein